MAVGPGCRGLDGRPWMGTLIPMRSLLLSKLLRSSWTVAALSLTVATLLEWGLMAQGGSGLLQAAGSD